MARPPSYQRDDAIGKIRELSAKHGVQRGAKLAREEFPDVPLGTWGRWRQAAVGNLADADLQPQANQTHESPRVVQAPIRQTKSIPATDMSPGPVLRFWEALDELEHDARLLRDFALAKDADGKTKVRVPFALRDAHKMRCELLRIALLQAGAAWSAERTQGFFQALIEEIGLESKDCQARILERMRQVHGEASIRGF